MTSERWAPLPGWPGYEGTPCGRLRRKGRERTPSGYHGVYSLHDGPRTSSITMGRLGLIIARELGIPPITTARPLEQRLGRPRKGASSCP